MAQHSFRSLWAEHRALQEEADALRLHNAELQRRLRRQESLAYEVRTDLASERQSKKLLEEGMDRQQQIITALRGDLEDLDNAQNELQERLDKKEASEAELEVRLSNQEDAYQALQVKYKESDERITKGIADETQQAYRWYFAAYERADAAEKRADAAEKRADAAEEQAAEEKARADAEKERADAQEEEVEVEAEVNNRLFQELMYARDRNNRLNNDTEAFFRTGLTLRAENLVLRSRLQWTESGIFRRIRDDNLSAANSDDEED